MTNFDVLIRDMYDPHHTREDKFNALAAFLFVWKELHMKRQDTPADIKAWLDLEAKDD